METNTDIPRLIEFRTKWQGEYWADNIAVCLTDTLPANRVEDFIDATFVNPLIVEVRWNYFGSSQGHYHIPKNTMLNEKNQEIFNRR